MESSLTAPLLSIAIPTYNRADYLALTLRQLHAQIAVLVPGLVEVIVSDNASPDGTAAVVAAAIAAGLDIRVTRNAENIGSDANIAQAFNLASGRYVLILGDDDIPLPGSLDWLLQSIQAADYGVIYLRPYGYSVNFKAEFPGGKGEDIGFADPGKYLTAIGPYVTLISACVINKAILGKLDASQYCGGNLVQVHLVIQAAMLAKLNLYSSHYRVACKRNNSGGYDRATVFVRELGKIFDRYRSMGLTDSAIRHFETRLIVGFHPYYLLKQRETRSGDLVLTYRTFVDRYSKQWLFWIWLAPTLCLPRPPALVWGHATNIVGRILTGDLKRGMAFLRDAKLRRPRSDP